MVPGTWYRKKSSSKHNPPGILTKMKWHYRVVRVREVLDLDKAIHVWRTDSGGRPLKSNQTVFYSNVKQKIWMNSHRKLLLPGAAIGNRNSVFSSALTFHPLLPIRRDWPLLRPISHARQALKESSLLFGAKREANEFPESWATGIFKTSFLHHRIFQNLFSQTGFVSESEFWTTGPQNIPKLISNFSFKIKLTVNC